MLCSSTDCAPRGLQPLWPLSPCHSPVLLSLCLLGGESCLVPEPLQMHGQPQVREAWTNRALRLNSGCHLSATRHLPPHTLGICGVPSSAHWWADSAVDTGHCDNVTQGRIWRGRDPSSPPRLPWGSGEPLIGEKPCGAGGACCRGGPQLQVTAHVSRSRMALPVFLFCPCVSEVISLWPSCWWEPKTGPAGLLGNKTAHWTMAWICPQH